MLENITWHQYLAAASATACVYYGYVFYKHYRKNFLHRFNREQEDSAFPISGADQGPSEEESLLSDLEVLVNSIKISIFEKAGKQADKEELKEQILVLSASYRGLHKPAYRSALNNFIIRYGEEICAVDFSEEELEEMWIGLRG